MCARMTTRTAAYLLAVVTPQATVAHSWSLPIGLVADGLFTNKSCGFRPLCLVGCGVLIIKIVMVLTRKTGARAIIVISLLTYFWLDKYDPPKPRSCKPLPSSLKASDLILSTKAIFIFEGFFA